MKYFLRFIVVTLGLNLSLATVSSQSNHYLSFFDNLQIPDSNTQAKVTINQSDEIESFVFKHLSKTQGTKVQGWRIRVYSGRGHQALYEWDRLSVELQQKYNVSIYKEFEHPHYKIYMGDFRTRNEALKFSKQIEHKYNPLINGPRDIIVKYNND